MKLFTSRSALAGLLALGVIGCKKPNDASPAPTPFPPALTFTVTTLAGGRQAGYANGPGAAAQFDYATDVTLDQQGNLYVSDASNNRIRKITPSGVVSTLAGSGVIGQLNGPGNVAQFTNPTSVAVDAQGQVYVADASSFIRVISPAGVVSTFAGMAGRGLQDGPLATAKFSSLTDLAFDQQGNLFVGESQNNRIRKITPQGIVSTVAGGAVGVAAPFGYVDGPASSARFAGPEGLAIDKQGNIYVADVNNNRIRKVSTTGIISTVAGSGDKDFADGQGTQAKFSYPAGLVVDADGTLYVSDYGNGCIRRVGIDGQVSVAASSNKGFGDADGTSTAAQFYGPQGIALSASGRELYITDISRIRKAVGQ